MVLLIQLLLVTSWHVTNVWWTMMSSTLLGLDEHGQRFNKGWRSRNHTTEYVDSMAVGVKDLWQLWISHTIIHPAHDWWLPWKKLLLKFWASLGTGDIPWWILRFVLSFRWRILHWKSVGKKFTVMSKVKCHWWGSSIRTWSRVGFWENPYFFKLKATTQTILTAFFKEHSRIYPSLMVVWMKCLKTSSVTGRFGCVVQPSLGVKYRQIQTHGLCVDWCSYQLYYCPWLWSGWAW